MGRSADPIRQALMAAGVTLRQPVAGVANPGPMPLAARTNYAGHECTAAGAWGIGGSWQLKSIAHELTMNNI